MIERMLRPLRNRVDNLVARAVIQLVSDGYKLQRIQSGVLAGEDVDQAERFQEYGFSSVPMAGAEGVALFVGGDRGHPLIVAVDDRRYRPTGLEPGEVTLYHKDGARVVFKDGGDVEVYPGAGGEVRIGSASASDPVALKSDLTALKTWLDAHTHPANGSPPSPPQSPSPAGATKVKAV